MSCQSLRRQCSLFSAIFAFIILTADLGIGIVEETLNKQNQLVSSSNRKLLLDSEVVEPTRVGVPGVSGSHCSETNLDITQGQTDPLPNGIPTYTVIITNTCPTGCSVSNIHLSCGAYSSARLVNPSIFRRLQINDCLVNDGKPIPPAQVISFTYANTFSYPMNVKSLTC